MALDHGLKTVPNDKTNLAFFDQRGKLNDQNQGTFVYNEFESIKVKLVNYAGKLEQKKVFLIIFAYVYNLYRTKKE